jgi:cytochrome c oxidase assembly protein subunit 15
VTVRRLALAALVANTVIVLTGGAVRLTDSGLGCPTVPRCVDGSYVPTPATAGHGLIEFGNRMLTFVLTAVVLAALVGTIRHRPRRRPLVRLATVVALGVPAQAVLGAVTVLTDLNPWTVAGHFLLSMGILAIAVTLWARSRELSDRPAAAVVRPEMLALGRTLVAVTAAVLALGTVVTGSGPHAGDAAAPRTGLDLENVAQLHADAVLLLIGLTVATVLGLRATGAPAAVRRAAAGLLAIEVGQGLLGFVQYFTGIPALLVGAHLLGACLVWIAACRLLLAMRARPATEPPESPGLPAPAEPADPAAPAAPAAAQAGSPGDGAALAAASEPVSR